MSISRNCSGQGGGHMGELQQLSADLTEGAWRQAGEYSPLTRAWSPAEGLTR